MLISLALPKKSNMLNRRVSVTKKLIINFFVLSLLPLVVIDTFFYSKAKEALIGRTFDQLNFVRAEKTTRINNFLQQRMNDASNMARNKESLAHLRLMAGTKQHTKTDTVSQVIFNNFLRAYLETSNCYSSVCYFAFPATVERIPIRADTLPGFSMGWLKEVYSRIESEEQVLVEEFNHPEREGDPQVLFVSGIYENDIKLGLIVLSVPLSEFGKIMFDNNPSNGLGQSGEAYLVGPDFLMRSHSRFKADAVMKMRVQTEGVKMALSGLNGTDIFSDYRGIKVLSSFNRIEVSQLNWVLLAEIDEDEAMIPIFILRNSILYLSIIIGLLLLGIVIFNATWIMMPIKKLKLAADSISGGNYGETITLRQQDEIGDLVEAFNTMSQTLQDQSERIEHEKIIRTTSMIDAQEDERQYLSRELHDGLGQLILATRMKLDQLSGCESETNTRLIGEARELIGVTVNEIRNISNHLMPAVLHEFGLQAAINRLAIETSGNGPAQVTFISGIDDKELVGQRLQIYLYRIVQEALNNVVKHARANSVLIELSGKNETICLKIQDDGQGFDLGRKRILSGNGISNMKERTNLLGGHFGISSEPGKGTSIAIEIPC